MTSYQAIELCEGFGSGEEASEAEQLNGWAYLINTGEVWHLQGWYGRTAASLIESGIISKTGEVLRLTDEG